MTAGVVAEFNPFHLGHARLLEAAAHSGASAVVVAMSGSFVQRGEAALCSKSARARCALLNGADAVLLLPTVWACANAEAFARAGVELLWAAGADTLFFGSECGDVDRLEALAQGLMSEALTQETRRCLSEGVSFAHAREAAAIKLFGESAAAPLGNPNDILAIEYIKAAKKLALPLSFRAVKRIGAQHDSGESADGIMSASGIRERVRAKPDREADFARFIPESAQNILVQEIKDGHAPSDMAYIERAVLARLRQMNAEDFALLPDISEGLENRFASAVREARTLDGLYSAVKTKRYTHARIRRLVLHAFLGITAQDVAGAVPYIRPLGFNERGLAAISAGRTELPVVARYSDASRLSERGRRIYDLECAADDMFALTLPTPLPCGEEQRAALIHSK